MTRPAQRVNQPAFDHAGGREYRGLLPRHNDQEAFG